MDENSEIKIKNLEEENKLLLLQLHQVQEELERYFLKLKSIKSENYRGFDSSPSYSFYNSTPQGPYGAGDRIRGQLSYRLGRALISQSKSFKGWISLPWALRKVIREFRVEKSSGSNEKLPSIESYADAYDADRVRQHLSFRLGSVLIQRSRSPIGWMILPWALLKTIKDFRNGVSWNEPATSKKWRMGYLVPGIRKLELQIFEKQTRIEKVSLIQKKLEHKLGLQAKLASERQSALEGAVTERDALKKTVADRAARIAELEAQVSDQAERQKQIDEQMIRAETQLEMLKEFMRP
jgi:hypothetical protein